MLALLFVEKLGDKNKLIHRLFDIGLIAKAVDGVLEILGGAVLCFATPSQINWMAQLLTQHELGEDSHGVLANLLLHSVEHLSSGTKVFAAIFLLWHGAVKVGLVWALLQKQWWAYPIAMVAFALFLVYQIYRYSHTHSVWLIVLSFLDVFVILITWLEYKRLHTSRELRGIPSET